MNNSMLYILMSLKNAALVKKSFIKICITKKNIPLVKLLYKKGLIQSIQVLGYEKNKNNIQVALYLRYYYNISLLENLKIVSSPTSKKILLLKDIIRMSESNNILFISTTSGLSTLLECKKNKTGGVILFTC